MEQSYFDLLTEKVIQSESGARTAVDQKKPLYADATGATAPSLKKRKNRSSRNALKSGIFSKSLILESESRDEYQLLLNGVRKDLQPEGTVESELVESIAFLLWRNRRLLQAENAEIAKARFSTPLEAYEKQQAELWDRYRAGETAGGILRPSSNPFLIQEAICRLRQLRDHIQEFGFDQHVDSFLLKKLYGVDHNGEPPPGVYRQFVAVLLRTAEALNHNEPAQVEELKNVMIKLFNIELEWLESEELMRKGLHERKGQFETLGALIPQPDAMDRVVRYETHLSRKFDRLLNQLERVQRIRRGQPAPPTLNVNIS